MKQLILSFCIAITFVACLSHEQKMAKKYGEQPEWVKHTPASSSHYYGVGAVSKQLSDYKQQAGKVALDNLVNEISVEISSSSQLSTFEGSTGFTQEFSQNIHLNSKAELEGYEKVGSWEDDTHYYSCYRLSKSLHKQLKEKRIKVALERAKNLYLSALDLQNSKNYKQALVNKVQALELLVNYLDAPLGTNINNTEVNLAVAIVHSIKTMEDELQMQSPFLNRKIKIGEYLGANDLFVNILDKDNTPLANIPVLFTYKSLTTSEHSTTSDLNGKASYNLGKIKSHRKHQEIFVRFDFNKVIQSTSKNRLVHKILNYDGGRKIHINLEVEQPTVFIELISSSIGSDGKESFLLELKKYFLNNRFVISEKENGSDAVCRIKLTQESLNKTNYHTAIYNASMSMFEKGSITFTNQTGTQKGTHRIKEEAIKRSLEKILEFLKKRSIPKYSNQYFSY